MSRPTYKITGEPPVHPDPESPFVFAKHTPCLDDAERCFERLQAKGWIVKLYKVVPELIKEHRP